MRRLQLYEEAQQARIERAAAFPPDPTCTRCKLHEGKKHRCLKPTGTGPGNILAVMESVTAEDDRVGRQGEALTAKMVASQLHRVTGGQPFLVDSALKCAGGWNAEEAQVDACRPYLHQTLLDTKPTRILAFGQRAVESLLGRAPQLLSVRRGYGWIWDAPWADPVTLGDGRVVRPVPVFLLFSPGRTKGNMLVRQLLDADIKWAATCPVPALPPWDAYTSVIEDGDDARLAAVAIHGAGKGVTLDVETAGRRHSGELRVVSISLAITGTTESWVWDRAALNDPGAFEVLAEILEDPTVPKGGTNMKFDLIAIVQGMGIEPRGLAWDARIHRKQLDSDADADLETMQELVGMGGGKDEFNEVIEALVAVERKRAQARKREMIKADPALGLALKGIKNQIPYILSKYATQLSDEDTRLLWRGAEPRAYVYGEAPSDLLSRYNATDAVSTGYLVDKLVTDLRTEDLWHAWEALWGPATEALVQVETWGFGVAKSQITTLSRMFGAQLDGVRRRFTAYPTFDPQSNDSIAELLYKTLKLKPTKLSEKTGAPSTDADSLEALQGKHPVVDDLLEYRRIFKLKSQYSDGLILHIAPDGRIHSTYNVDGARSGRASSQDPNMQNIPSEEKGPDGKLIKDCFIARPGYVLLASDYKQLEFRVAADLADDPVMRSVFESGQDFHQATAEFIAPIVWKITACPKCKDDGCHVTKAHRRGAKAFNFGIMYGMRDGSIAANAGTDMATAGQIRQAVLGKFRKFAAWVQQCLAYSRKTGLAWTYWHGRKAHRRQLLQIADMNDTASGAKITAENSSFNTPVQGTASFYCLASVTALVRWITRYRVDAMVVATVHDSIVLEVREDLLRRVALKMQEIMTNHPTMTNVKLDIDMKTGPVWGSLVTYVP